MEELQSLLIGLVVLNDLYFVSRVVCRVGCGKGEPPVVWERMPPSTAAPGVVFLLTKIFSFFVLHKFWGGETVAGVKKDCRRRRGSGRRRRGRRCAGLLFVGEGAAVGGEAGDGGLI